MYLLPYHKMLIHCPQNEKKVNFLISIDHSHPIDQINGVDFQDVVHLLEWTF